MVFINRTDSVSLYLFVWRDERTGRVGAKPAALNHITAKQPEPVVPVTRSPSPSPLLWSSRWRQSSREPRCAQGAACFLNGT